MINPRATDLTSLPPAMAGDNGKGKTMATRFYTRFILADNESREYEVSNSLGQAQRVEVKGDKVTRFWEDGPISRADMLASLNAFLQSEYDRFLVWAAKNNVNPDDFPARPNPLN